MTAADLAFDIIRKGRPQTVRFAPNGLQADAVKHFIGRLPSHELFITQGQYDYLMKLGSQNAIIVAGEGDSRFAAYPRSVYSRDKDKTFYILTFGGFVPPVAQEAPKPVAAPKGNRAINFAAVLIKSAIEKGRADKDDRAPAGAGEYLITWLSKGQADALMNMLPADAVNVQTGAFLTQPAGSFCFWGKPRTNSGAQLLCWMGEVAEQEGPKPSPAPIQKPATTPVVTGKRIPNDPDIPF